MAGLSKEQLDALGHKQPEIPLGMFAPRLSAVQVAYGLLWRSVTDDQKVNAARRELFSVLTLEDRRAAIAWVIEVHGSMTTNEIIAADIRVGQFPQKSVE